MDPTSSHPPPSPPKRSATKVWLGKGRRKEKSDKTEENFQAQRKEAPGLKHTHMTRTASAVLSQAELSRGPRAEPSQGPPTEQHGLGSSLFSQVHLPHPVDSTIASAFDANAALVSRPKPQPESTTGQSQSPTRESETTKASNARSKSPVKSMADLAFADKRIQATKIGSNPTQLPVDVREMYKRLNALSVGEAILPTLIKVSTLSGRMRPLLRANRYEDEIATAAEGDLLPSMFGGGTAEDARTREQLLGELEELDRILDESRECEENFFPEPAWNEAVHYPILQLALRSYAGVKVRNVYDRRRSFILYLING